MSGAEALILTAEVLSMDAIVLLGSFFLGLMVIGVPELAYPLAWQARRGLVDRGAV